MKDTFVNPIAWICAAAGALLAQIPPLTWLLVLLMFFDMSFGMARAYLQKDLSAEEARKGAIKKLGNLGLVAVVGIVGQILFLMGVVVPGVNFIQVATLFFVPYELFSIVKNADAMGVPVPPQLLTAMRFFQTAQGSNENKSLS
jgi:toxin secretion/phage lysis holin